MATASAAPSPHLGSYADLVRGFLDRGYACVPFTGLSSPEGQLVLRHDIDFDCGLAESVSLVEDELGVKGTYFFLMRSDSYNVLSPRNRDRVQRIRDRGHTVSIHFDPVLYEDVAAGLREERRLFESVFEVPVEIISLHRPSELFTSHDETIDGVEHTYQSKYFRDITYVSDSQGGFRFGHPHATEAFAAGSSMHLLTHPVWWTHDAASNIDALHRFLEARDEELRQHVADNCIPYREYRAAR